MGVWSAYMSVRQKAVRPSGSGVTDSYKSPYGNQTLVLWKSNQCPYLDERSLQPQLLEFRDYFLGEKEKKEKEEVVVVIRGGDQAAGLGTEA